MTKENIKKTLSFLNKKSVFCQIFRKKICIFKNLRVYTDKISMSGRSDCMLSNSLHMSDITYPEGRN